VWSNISVEKCIRSNNQTIVVGIQQQGKIADGFQKEAVWSETGILKIDRFDLPVRKGIGFPIVTKKSVESIQVEEAEPVNVSEINGSDGFGLLKIGFGTAAHGSHQPGDCDAVGK
jgi:hypothetical protein